MPLDRHETAGGADEQRLRVDVEHAPHRFPRAACPDATEVDAVVNRRQRPALVPAVREHVECAARHGDDPIGECPQHRLVNQLVSPVACARPPAHRLCEAVHGPDDVRDARQPGGKRSQHVVRHAVGVDQIDRVRAEESCQERHDLNRIVTAFVDHGRLDAQPLELALEPAIVEQHGAQRHVGLLGEIRGRRRHLNLGAGP